MQETNETGDSQGIGRRLLFARLVKGAMGNFWPHLGQDWARMKRENGLAREIIPQIRPNGNGPKAWFTAEPIFKEMPLLNLNAATSGFIRLMEQHPYAVRLMISAAVAAAVERPDRIYYCFYKDGIAGELGHDRLAPTDPETLQAYFGQNKSGGFTALTPEEY